ncbi:MAG: T9SS type A sorting domain-containing protein [Bacteroidales bacterium]|nr:T9SS type A sorting domain-containing protein [Bacteroidales bacterium]
MKKVFILLVILMYLIVPIYAQNPQWVQYTNGDEVTALAEEGNNMWVGTTGGLVKIDKSTGIQTFYNNANSGLPDNYVLIIAIDTSGSEWLGTNYGLAVYNENGIPVSIIENITSETHITIYPNPTTTIITIALPSTTHVNNTTLAIYNVNAQQVISRRITEPITVIDISTLPRGVYFVRITNDATVLVNKFMKL